MEYWSRFGVLARLPTPRQRSAGVQFRPVRNTPILQYSNYSITPTFDHSARFALETPRRFIVTLLSMKKLVVLVTLLPLVLLTSSIAGAFDLSKVHNLVVFGDSLSDNGNTFAAVGLPNRPIIRGVGLTDLIGSMTSPESLDYPRRLPTSRTVEPTSRSVDPRRHC